MNNFNNHSEALHSLPKPGPPTLQITICRYESSKLVKRSLPLNSIKYIAVSHVWGQATWQRVAGHEEKVLVSNEKAKFLAERLPSVVGDQYFWMDILCVNQRDSTERVAVTQHIPSIFRLAERTIVVRDSTGFQSCCAAVIGDVTWHAGPSTSEEACREYWGTKVADSTRVR